MNQRHSEEPPIVGKVCQSRGICELQRGYSTPCVPAVLAVMQKIVRNRGFAILRESLDLVTTKAVRVLTLIVSIILARADLFNPVWIVPIPLNGLCQSIVE
jgi:hypothetical protein